MIAMTQRANEAWGASTRTGRGDLLHLSPRQERARVRLGRGAGPGDARIAGHASDGAERGGESANAYASLPYDPFTPYLEGDSEIRMAGDTALPTGNRQSIKQTEWTYALMMHFSQSLGVNCTYCHNSRAFANWEQSPPTRLKAWHAIRMVRELNNKLHLGDQRLAARLPSGTVRRSAEVACNTCHQGAYKPLYGAPMIADYPNLAKAVGGAETLMSADEHHARKKQKHLPAPAGGGSENLWRVPAPGDRTSSPRVQCLVVPVRVCSAVKAFMRYRPLARETLLTWEKQP
jgi:photosynthetic reaction center cytochrome c subunit